MTIALEFAMRGRFENWKCCLIYCAPVDSTRNLAHYKFCKLIRNIIYHESSNNQTSPTSKNWRQIPIFSTWYLSSLELWTASTQSKKPPWPLKPWAHRLRCRRWWLQGMSCGPPPKLGIRFGGVRGSWSLSGKAQEIPRWFIWKKAEDVTCKKIGEKRRLFHEWLHIYFHPFFLSRIMGTCG